MTSRPVTVSVVIPAYDRPEMLKLAVESVLAQTYEDFEVIVVDDASPRPLEPVVESLDDVRIQYHRLQENRGAGAARNHGITHACGEYVAFLDDDDRWEPTKLEKQVAALEANPTVGVVYTGQRIVDESDETLEVKQPDASGDLTRYLVSGGYLGGYSVAMVRSNVISSAGRPDPDLPIHQDKDWWLRLSAETTFHAIEEPLVVRQMGEYDQIGDRYEELRDVATPQLYAKHRAKARAEGLRFQLYFKSTLLESVGRAALATGRYSEARYYLFWALVYRPWSWGALIRFVVALGGRRSYRVALKLRDRAREARK